MKVLVLCEFSGVVRDAFLALAHNAWSCDLLPTESPVNNGDTSGHLVMDARRALTLASWDLVIAHPPCTFLTNAGGRWLYKGGKLSGGRDPERWLKMTEAAAFFMDMLTSSAARVCVENPIMHKYATRIVNTPKTQIIQPWQFGHAETKATCLWLRGLPKLGPTKIIPPDYVKYPAGRGNGYEPKCHYESPGADRGHRRSKTLAGIGAAMAEQWGSL